MLVFKRTENFVGFSKFWSALFRQMASLFGIEGGIVKIDCARRVGKSLGENRGSSREKRIRAKMISLKKENVEFKFFLYFLLPKSRLQLFFTFSEVRREEPLVTRKEQCMRIFLPFFDAVTFFMRIFLVLSLRGKPDWVKKKSGKSWKKKSGKS